MFDLETSIATWRHYLARRRGFLKEDLDELECHLRDAVAAARRRGATDEEAFRDALAAIGDLDGAEDEYRKVYWGKLQRQRRLGRELTARLSMLKNYLMTTVRALLRKKGYSFINIVGLTLGLAACLVIFQYVAFEHSFDRFHERGDDIYRVVTAASRNGEPLGDGEGGAFTPQALVPAIHDEIPEVQHATRLHSANPLVARPSSPDRVFEEPAAFYADPAFLEMFTFPLVSGDPSAPLAPGTLLLSETAARRYFGGDDPVGQVLSVTGPTQADYRVGGVFRDVPPNSHLQFDLLLPMDDLLRTGQYNDEPDGGWSWNNFVTYVQLRPDADPEAVGRKLTALLVSRRGDLYLESGYTEQGWVQPLREVHLSAKISTPAGITGSRRTVYFFTVIGLVTLLIALVNYVNLATARALDRAREVGVRKVVGAQREQLITQFLTESVLTNLLAAALAVGLVVLLTPFVNDLAGARAVGAFWSSPLFWGAFAATLAACTLLAGLYPAFVLSSFKPISVLKGRAGSTASGLWLRRGLVVVQFAASIVLIGGTAVVYEQLRYMRRMDLGLDLEQVLTVEGPRLLPEETELSTAMSTFTEELRRLPSVREVATSSTLPGQGFNWNGASVRRAEDDPARTIRGVLTWIDTSFAALYGLELVAGNPTAFLLPPDSTEWAWTLIPNETAVRALGFASPDEAVGHALVFGGYDAEIVGVFRDFNWSSAHEARQNIFFGRIPAGSQVSLRVTTDDLSGTIAAIESIYDRLFPGNVFDYAFVDEAFGEQYAEDQRFATLFTLFAGLAILIACLGLFGLASFTTQQRTKEIGVRKVLGASVPGLVAMLSRDFLKLVLVAVALATPLAYLLMRSWLDDFAYKMELGPGMFVLVAAATLLIAFLTVAVQAVRSATADPAQSLRVE